MTTGAEAGPRADTVEATGRALKALLGASRRLRGRETQRADGLSHAAYGLLFSLADGRESSMRDLAEQAALAPATVTQMLEGLETAGLVSRRRSDEDRRVVLIALTAAGAALVEQRRAEVEPLFRAALDGFTDDELAAAAAVIERLAGFYGELEARSG